MTVTKQLIDNVNKIKTTLNEISVYNLDVKTSLELYYELAKKVNEVINELSRFEGVVSEEVVEQNKKLIYLLGEGLKEQVGLKIDELITNGTMDSIINHKIFNDLNNKIDTFKQEVNEQFKTKANKNEVRENTNIKPINISEMDTETKKLFTGGSVAVVGENAVGFENIKPKSLTLSKFKNYPVTGIPSKNLFDKNSITKGFYVSYQTGELAVNNDYSVSDFIEVDEGEKYACSRKEQLAFYDVNYNFVSGLGTNTYTVITIPVGVKYVRLNCANNDLDIYQLEKGTEVTEYEEFYPKLSENSIPKTINKKINNPNYIKRIILEELENPFKPTNIKLIGDSITAGVGGTGYSATGNAIGTTGYKEPVCTSTSWANMLYNNIMTKYKREHYISPTDPNIKVTKKVGTSTYPVVENFNLCKMHWRYKLHNLSSDKKGLKLRFYGDTIKILYMKKSNTGTFEVLVDGISHGVVDTYIGTGTTYSNEYIVSGLAKGHHSIEVVETNTRNSLSTKNEFYIEGFVINKEIEFKNYAISGKDSEFYYLNREQTISADDDIIIMQLGTNDRKTRGLEANAILKSYQREIIKYANSLGCKVISMCANPSTDESERGFRMCDVNTAIKQIADEFNMPFISNYNWFIEYCNVKGIELDTLLDDGLHPNDDGYRVMYENIARHLGLSIIS